MNFGWFVVGILNGAVITLLGCQMPDSWQTCVKLSPFMVLHFVVLMRLYGRRSSEEGNNGHD